MSGLRSRNKGKVGERDAAELLREHGFTEAKRGVQYQGSPDSPDCIGLPGFHVEVKRRAKPTTACKWLRETYANSGILPGIVFHRADRHPWNVTLDASVFLKILHDAEYGKGAA